MQGSLGLQELLIISNRNKLITQKTNVRLTVEA